MTIEIKKLSAKHLNAFFALRLEALQASPTSYMSSFEEEKQQGLERYQLILSVNDNTNLICGAFDANQLIGIIGIRRERNTKAKHKCVIWGLYVKSDYHRQGVGKLLMEHVLSHVKNNAHCTQITLSVETTNIAAITLYQSLGFKIWGTEPKALFVNDTFYDEHHMILFKSNL